MTTLTVLKQVRRKGQISERNTSILTKKKQEITLRTITAPAYNYVFLFLFNPFRTVSNVWRDLHMVRLQNEPLLHIFCAVEHTGKGTSQLR